MVGSHRSSIARIVVAAIGLMAAGAQADEIADLYRGKTVSILVGTSPGNDYDLRARLIGKYLSKTLPGQPTIVVRNMPGAGGITAANNLAQLAPRDGTSLHALMSNMMAAQALGTAGVKYDTREFAFIGNSTNAPNVMAAWHASGIKSYDDLKARRPMVGAPMGTSGATYAEAMNALLGTKLNIVTGYPGGVEVNLAMERGEVEVRASNSWAAWKATNAEWIADKKINFIMQVGLQRHPDLKDVPLLLELAQTDEARDILRFLSAETAISRTMVLAPGAPKERIEAMRRAYDAVMIDAAFLADADKAKMDVSAMKGEEAQVIANAIVDTNPATIARARALLGDLLK
ncbi:MAG: tripartite tricarboxylate transporter family receptor [Hyphomicrobiales bacterium]|nr:tripartite tricarboxylate transporter family receptor [Hyphomicrobiales bacterium]